MERASPKVTSADQSVAPRAVADLHSQCKPSTVENMTQAESAEVTPDPVPFQWQSVLRSVQTPMPTALHEWRLDLQQWSYQVRRRPHEAEFLALRDLLPPDAVCIDSGRTVGNRSTRSTLSWDGRCGSRRSSRNGLWSGG